MAQAPKDLSGEVVIHHPNCGADFQFRQYDEQHNVNYFQCVGCGLAIRVDAFMVGDVQEQTSPQETSDFDTRSDQEIAAQEEPSTEDTAEQDSEPEPATTGDIIEHTDETPGKKHGNSKRKQQPDHIR